MSWSLNTAGNDHSNINKVSWINIENKDLCLSKSGIWWVGSTLMGGGCLRIAETEVG